MSESLDMGMTGLDRRAGMIETNYILWKSDEIKITTLRARLYSSGSRTIIHNRSNSLSTVLALGYDAMMC